MDEKVEKSRKRNLEDFLTRDQNPESEEQNEPQQSKKKKQKKNKKSKEQRESNETSEPDVPLNIVSNDDNETVKKKKDKKVELVVEVELFSNCVIKGRSERSERRPFLR